MTHCGSHPAASCVRVCARAACVRARGFACELEPAELKLHPGRTAQRCGARRRGSAAPTAGCCHGEHTGDVGEDAVNATPELVCI